MVHFCYVENQIQLYIGFVMGFIIHMLLNSKHLGFIGSILDYIALLRSYALYRADTLNRNT